MSVPWLESPHHVVQHLASVIVTLLSPIAIVVVCRKLYNYQQARNLQKGTVPLATGGLRRNQVASEQSLASSVETAPYDDHARRKNPRGNMKSQNFYGKLFSTVGRQQQQREWGTSIDREGTSRGNAFQDGGVRLNHHSLSASTEGRSRGSDCTHLIQERKTVCYHGKVHVARHRACGSLMQRGHVQAPLTVTVNQERRSPEVLRQRHGRSPRREGCCSHSRQCTASLQASDKQETFPCTGKPGTSCPKETSTETRHQHICAENVQSPCACSRATQNAHLVKEVLKGRNKLFCLGVDQSLCSCCQMKRKAQLVQHKPSSAPSCCLGHQATCNSLDVCVGRRCCRGKAIHQHTRATRSAPRRCSAAKREPQLGVTVFAGHGKRRRSPPARRQGTGTTNPVPHATSPTSSRPRSRSPSVERRLQRATEPHADLTRVGSLHPRSSSPPPRRRWSARHASPETLRTQMSAPEVLNVCRNTHEQACPPRHDSIQQNKRGVTDGGSTSAKHSHRDDPSAKGTLPKVTRAKHQPMPTERKRITGSSCPNVRMAAAAESHASSRRHQSPAKNKASSVDGVRLPGSSNLDRGTKDAVEMHISPRRQVTNPQSQLSQNDVDNSGSTVLEQTRTASDREKERDPSLMERTVEDQWNTTLRNPYNARDAVLNVAGASQQGTANTSSLSSQSRKKGNLGERQGGTPSTDTSHNPSEKCCADSDPHGSPYTRQSPQQLCQHSVGTRVSEQNPQNKHEHKRNSLHHKSCDSENSRSHLSPTRTLVDAVDRAPGRLENLQQPSSPVGTQGQSEFIQNVKDEENLQPGQSETNRSGARKDGSILSSSKPASDVERTVPPVVPPKPDKSQKQTWLPVNVEHPCGQTRSLPEPDDSRLHGKTEVHVRMPKQEGSSPLTDECRKEANKQTEDTTVEEDDALSVLNVLSPSPSISLTEEMVDAEGTTESDDAAEVEDYFSSFREFCPFSQEHTEDKTAALSCPSEPNTKLQESRDPGGQNSVSVPGELLGGRHRSVGKYTLRYIEHILSRFEDSLRSEGRPVASSVQKEENNVPGPSDIHNEKRWPASKPQTPATATPVVQSEASAAAPLLPQDLQNTPCFPLIDTVETIVGKLTKLQQIHRQTKGKSRPEHNSVRDSRPDDGDQLSSRENQSSNDSAEDCLKDSSRDCSDDCLKDRPKVRSDDHLKDRPKVRSDARLKDRPKVRSDALLKDRPKVRSDDRLKDRPKVSSNDCLKDGPEHHSKVSKDLSKELSKFSPNGGTHPQANQNTTRHDKNPHDTNPRLHPPAGVDPVRTTPPNHPPQEGQKLQKDPHAASLIQTTATAAQLADPGTVTAAFGIIISELSSQQKEQLLATYGTVEEQKARDDHQEHNSSQASAACLVSSMLGVKNSQSSVDLGTSSASMCLSTAGGGEEEEQEISVRRTLSVDNAFQLLGQAVADLLTAMAMH